MAFANDHSHVHELAHAKLTAAVGDDAVVTAGETDHFVTTGISNTALNAPPAGALGNGSGGGAIEMGQNTGNAKKGLPVSSREGTDAGSDDAGIHAAPVVVGVYLSDINNTAKRGLFDVDCLLYTSPSPRD